MQKDPGFAGVAGRLRTPDRPEDVVQIGSFVRKEESIYNPAPPRQVKRCLDEVLEWMSDDSVIELGDAGMGMALPIRILTSKVLAAELGVSLQAASDGICAKESEHLKDWYTFESESQRDTMLAGCC